MKLTKQELKQKISDSITDNDDLVISLLEDIEDSMQETTENVLNETLQKENEDLKYKYEDLKARYKERFLSGDNAEEKIEEDKKEEGLQEKEYIDIKEI